MRAIRFIALLLAVTGSAQANSLNNWQLSHGEGSTTVRLNFSATSPNPAIFSSDDPPRLTVDLPDVQYTGQQVKENFQQGIVKNIFTASASGKTRVLLNLNSASKYQLVQGKKHINLILRDATRKASSASRKPSQAKAKIKKTAKKSPSAASRAAGYRGKPINMQFQDIDVRSALQVIAEVSDFNIVVNDSVTGNITLRLKDTPWDQALDVILTAKGLGKRVNGNVIYVAPVEELNKNEQMELAAKKTREQLTQLSSALIAVNYAKAKDLAELIKASSAKDGQDNEASEQDQLLSKRGSVNADIRTNTLLVMETAEKIARIRKLVKRLDVPVAQVLIESRIVIATNEFADELGVRVGGTALNTSGSGINTISGSSAANSAMLADATTTGLPVGIPALGDRLAVNLPVANPAGRIGLALLNSDFLLDLELSALQAEGRGEIVSNPRVIASNQHEATIEQGIEIPYLSVSEQGTSVLFKKATLKLAVTPLITPDNRITLDLEVYKDNLGREVPSGQGGFIPSIDTRQLQTQVVTDDGQTVVLGGIYETTIADSVSKVPFLGDLPVLGGLFRTTKKSDQKNELLIFITPKVIEENIKLEF